MDTQRVHIVVSQLCACRQLKLCYIPPEYIGTNEVPYVAFRSDADPDIDQCALAFYWMSSDADLADAREAVKDFIETIDKTNGNDTNVICILADSSRTFETKMQEFLDTQFGPRVELKAMWHLKINPLQRKGQSDHHLCEYKSEEWIDAVTKYADAGNKLEDFPYYQHYDEFLWFLGWNKKIGALVKIDGHDSPGWRVIVPRGYRSGAIITTHLTAQ